MNIRRVLRKALCSSEKTTEDEEKIEKGSTTPSQEPGSLNSTSSKDIDDRQHPISQGHLSDPQPSQFQTSPPLLANPIAEVSKKMSSESPDHPSPRQQLPPQRRQPQRRSTIELQENKEYRPKGGPDYLRILAKYHMLGDKSNERVICRFVRPGNTSERRPEIVKIDNISPQANQEFLAHVVIGNSDKPQGRSLASLR